MQPQTQAHRSDVAFHEADFLADMAARHELGRMLARDDLAVLERIADEIRRHHDQMDALIQALSVGSAGPYDQITAATIEIDFLEALEPDAARIVRAHAARDMAGLA